MILRPARVADAPTREPLPAWDVILATQNADDDVYLIAQDDHARLAGEIASYLSLKGLPPIDTEVIDGIKLHDFGWKPIDDAADAPTAFVAAPPADTARAWIGSIERAAQAGPTAGFIVSRHFCRIGRAFGSDDATKAGMLTQFLKQEEVRQAQLAQASRRPAEQLEALTDLLQLCDLISLYLCCGARQSIVFPQCFAGEALTLAPAVTGFAFRPSALREPRVFQFSGRRYAQATGRAAEPTLFTIELR